MTIPGGGPDGRTVGIAGAGAVALATAAFLHETGARPVLWSPSGAATADFVAGAPLVATGAVRGHFVPAVAADAEELARRCDTILIAVPAYGHRAVMDALAPHLGDAHAIIVSSHASFGALYLSRSLAERGVSPPIIAWGTTLATGRRGQGSGGGREEQAGEGVEVGVNTVRSRIDMCVLPQAAGEAGSASCRELFGDRFVQRDGLLAIALSNLNPQNHMGIALGNMTRMEHGETWSQGANVTPNVGRLLEALDAERLAIAEALGLEVRTIFEHFHLSFHVPVASIAEMNARMHEEGRGGTGPATADSRYVTEDVPYGLVPTELLGDLTGRPALLHRAGVDVFSAMYGRNFRAENELLTALDLKSIPLDELRTLAKTGYIRG